MEVSALNNSGRDKTKQKRNPYIENLKDGDDDVCGAVLDSFSNDYLNYISGLVKASKTPGKTKNQERIERLFEQKVTQVQEKYPVNKDKKQMVVYKHQSKQLSERSSNSDEDVKNLTVPLKMIKQISETQNGQIKRHKNKSRELFQEKDESFVFPKRSKTFNLQECHYDRFPTQEAEKSIRSHKYEQVSMICKSESSEGLSNQYQPKSQFIEGIDEYLEVLQSKRKPQTSYNKKQKTKNSDDLISLEQLYQQNIKLRKKVKKYEQKMQSYQKTLQDYMDHCKRQQKANKAKVHDLEHALFRAISKIKEQKEKYDETKIQFQYLSRKAGYCANKNFEQSQDDEEIVQTLLKSMRPSRASSQYKTNRKGLRIASKEN